MSQSRACHVVERKETSSRVDCRRSGVASSWLPMSITVKALCGIVLYAAMSFEATKLTGADSVGAVHVEQLIARLRDAKSDADTRRTAAWALGRLGPAAAVSKEALQAAIKDADSSVRLAAAESLISVGGPADSILTLLDQEVGEARRSIVELAIGRLPPAKVLPSLLTLKDADDIVEMFGPKTADEFAPVIFDALAEGKGCELLRLLGPLDQRYLPRLIKLLDSEHAKVRTEARRRIAMSGDEGRAALVKLRSLLSRFDEDERLEIMVVIAKLDPAAREFHEPVQTLLRSRSYRERQRGLGAVRDLGPRASGMAELIVAASLGDETERDDWPQKDAVWQLGAAAIAPLREALRRQKCEVMLQRVVARIELLGETASPAVPELVDIARNAERAVETRVAAIHALRAIKVRKESVSVAASGLLSDAKAEVVDATLAMLPKLTPPPRELAAAVERMTVEKAQTHGAWRLRTQAMATLLAIDERPERHVAEASKLISEFLATVTDDPRDKVRDRAGDEKTVGDKAGDDKAGKDEAGKDAADKNETEEPDDPTSIWKRPEDARAVMDLIDALGELGPKSAPAVPALIKLLASPGGISYVFSVETFAQHATGALAKIGPPAAPALVGQLSSSEAIRRSTAAQILGRIGPAVAEVSVKPLVARLDDRAKTSRNVGCIGFDVSVRQDCLEALGKLGSASGEIAPRLIDELSRHEWNEITREFANVARLAGTRPALIEENEPAKPVTPEPGTEPQPPLTMVEENSDAVLETLGRLGANAKPAISVLLKIVEEGDLNEASSALLALARLDPRSPTSIKSAGRLRARFGSLATAPIEMSMNGRTETLLEAIETLAPHSPEIRDWLPSFWDAPLMSAPTRIAAAEAHARLAPDDPRPVAYLRWETKRGLVIWDDTARAALERVTRSERRGQP